jgi:hypothetical protein
MREEPRQAPRAAKVDFRPLRLLRRDALVSAMLKPTLIGSAARAGTVAHWTTANKNCERDTQNGASCGGRHRLISSRAMTAATAWRFARF